MTGKIPYYRVAKKNGRAYWCPTRRMKRLGFETITLGDDGEDARAAAHRWNTRWHEYLKTRTNAPGYKEPSAGRSFVYFIEIDDLIKIGVSRRPYRRIQNITGSAHGPATRVIVVPGTRADEKYLHRAHRRHRSNGEWFRAASPVLEAMLRAARLGHIERREMDKPATDAAPAPKRVESSGVESAAGLQ